MDFSRLSPQHIHLANKHSWGYRRVRGLSAPHRFGKIKTSAHKFQCVSDIYEKFHKQNDFFFLKEDEGGRGGGGGKEAQIDVKMIENDRSLIC